MELAFSCKLLHLYFVINILWGSFQPAQLRILYNHPFSQNSVRYKTGLGVKWLEVFATQDQLSPWCYLHVQLVIYSANHSLKYLQGNQIRGTVDGQLWNMQFEGEFVHHVGSLKQICNRVFRVCFIFLQNLASCIVNICYWGNVSPLSSFVHCTILAIFQVPYIMDLRYCPGPTPP